MKYSFQYKCRLCGEIIPIGTIESNPTDIAQQLSKTLFMEEHMNGQTGDKKMITIHHCGNGGIGFADLLGAQSIRIIHEL